jgi:hypothetical protein
MKKLLFLLLVSYPHVRALAQGDSAKQAFPFPNLIAEVNGHYAFDEKKNAFGTTPGTVLYIGRPGVKHHQDVTANVFFVVENAPEHFSVKGYVGMSKNFSFAEEDYAIPADVTTGLMVGLENSKELGTIAPYVFAKTKNDRFSVMTIVMLSSDISKTSYLVEVWYNSRPTHKFVLSVGALNFGSSIGPVVRVTAFGAYAFVGPTYNPMTTHSEEVSMKNPYGVHAALGLELNKPIHWVRQKVFGR